MAEAGRADVRAVRAGEAALGDLVPARVLAVAVQQVRHVGGLEGAAHAFARPVGDAFGRDLLVRGRLPSLDGREQVRPARAPHVDDEPVVELGQREVEPDRAPRPRVHRVAEAGPARLLAVHADEHGALATVPVGGIELHEHAVLHRDRVQVARAEPDERVRRVVGGRGLHRERPVATDRRQPLAWREQEALPGIGAVRPPEQTIVVAMGEAVRPGALGLADADREVAHALDTVQHDRPVPHGRPDQPEPLLRELVEQGVESGAIQVPHACTPPPSSLDLPGTTPSGRTARLAGDLRPCVRAADGTDRRRDARGGVPHALG